MANRCKFKAALLVYLLVMVIEFVGTIWAKPYKTDTFKTNKKGRAYKTGWYNKQRDFFKK